MTGTAVPEGAGLGPVVLPALVEAELGVTEACLPATAVSVGGVRCGSC